SAQQVCSGAEGVTYSQLCLPRDRTEIVSAARLAEGPAAGVSDAFGTEHVERASTQQIAATGHRTIADHQKPEPMAVIERVSAAGLVEGACAGYPDVLIAENIERAGAEAVVANRAGIAAELKLPVCLARQTQCV